MRRPTPFPKWWLPLVQTEEGEEVLVPSMCCPAPLRVEEVLYIVDDDYEPTDEFGGLVLECTACGCRWLLEWVGPFGVDEPPSMTMLGARD